MPTLKKELVKLIPLMSGCYAGLRIDGLYARMLLVKHAESLTISLKPVDWLKSDYAGQFQLPIATEGSVCRIA